MTTAPATGSGQYARVNGLEMYYEIHGSGQPLVLLHGAFSGIGTSFGRLLPGLSKHAQCIAVELQGHGHTADIDRPLRLAAMAEDVAALLRQLGIESADLFGYSMGGAVALRVALRHPELVRKLVLAAISFTNEGMHPGLLEGLDAMQPEMMVGSPFHQEYMSIAPRPEDFARLFQKKKEMDKLEGYGVDLEAIKSLTAPTLVIIGDSDIVRPEHGVEMFRLLGGGVIGDLVGLPRSQLAILPGTTHITVADRDDLIVPMVTKFLATPG